MEKVIIHDPVNQRFEMKADGQTAYIRYIAFEGGMDIVTTRVPAPLEGRGMASALTEYALAYARRQGLRIVPSCSFTAAYLRRHPEYRDLEK